MFQHSMQKNVENRTCRCLGCVAGSAVSVNAAKHAEHGLGRYPNVDGTNLAHCNAFVQRVCNELRETAPAHQPSAHIRRIPPLFAAMQQEEKQIPPPKETQQRLHECAQPLNRVRFRSRHSMQFRLEFVDALEQRSQVQFLFVGKVPVHRPLGDSCLLGDVFDMNFMKGSVSEYVNGRS